MKVHTLIGPGLGEEIYHRELVTQLIADGVEFLSKPRRELVYRGIVADVFEPDLIVENHFIPELKSLQGKFCGEHMVQVFCYSKFWQLPVSMLVDFGKQSLIWERFLYRSRFTSLPDREIPVYVSTPSLAEEIIQVVRNCLVEIGLGYRQTTWKGLVSAAIQAAGHEVQRTPTAMVLDHLVVPIDSLVVDGICAVYVTALNDAITATDRAVFQTHLHWLDLDWGLLFHFGKSTADFRIVGHPKRCPRPSA